MIHKGSWQDAQALAQEFPDSFEAPSTQELAAVKAGFTVKISDGEERFWVQVESVEGDELIGAVDNALIGGQPYAELGSRVRFKLRHIYQIDSPADIDHKALLMRLLLGAGMTPAQAIQFFQ